jgi:hypothetical protein
MRQAAETLRERDLYPGIGSALADLLDEAAEDVELGGYGVDEIGDYWPHLLFIARSIARTINGGGKS